MGLIRPYYLPPMFPQAKAKIIVHVIHEKSFVVKALLREDVCSYHAAGSHCCSRKRKNGVRVSAAALFGFNWRVAEQRGDQRNLILEGAHSVSRKHGLKVARRDHAVLVE